jgi:accessory gene regulator B
MKNLIIDYSLYIIKKNSNNINKEKLQEIGYGLEALYLTISKLFLVILITIFLGIIREFLLFFIFYNFIRLFAFGLHASKSSICWLVSLTFFILIPYTANFIIIPFEIKILISLFCFVSLTLYAPADTQKRPLINNKKRSTFKLLSLSLGLIYTSISFFSSNVLLVNVLLMALLFESLLILPISYKFFNMPYNNYKTYNY